MYIAQLFWGVIIHFFKPKPKTSEARKRSSQHLLDPSTTSVPFNSTASYPRYAPTYSNRAALLARPIQNYGHAINGLFIIGLASYNVHEGYGDEWLEAFGVTRSQSQFLRSMNAWFISWVFVSFSIPFFNFNFWLLMRGHSQRSYWSFICWVWLCCRDNGGRRQMRGGESPKGVKIR